MVSAAPIHRCYCGRPILVNLSQLFTPFLRLRPSLPHSPTHPTHSHSSIHYVQACEERIKSDETGEAHCTGQYFDYWHCVDKCVAPRLFAALK